MLLILKHNTTVLQQILLCNCVVLKNMCTCDKKKTKDFPSPTYCHVIIFLLYCQFDTLLDNASLIKSESSTTTTISTRKDAYDLSSE